MSVSDELIQDLINGPQDYLNILNRLIDLERDDLIVLYAGTYSFKLALEFLKTDHAYFYFYSKDSRIGYMFYINPMGVRIVRDDEIFSFNHRRLYNKAHLTSIFFGEKDNRSGEYFSKSKWSFFV